MMGDMNHPPTILTAIFLSVLLFLGLCVITSKVISMLIQDWRSYKKNCETDRKAKEELARVEKMRSVGLEWPYRER